MEEQMIRRLRERASRVANHLNRLPEEQLEAILNASITYKPKSILDRVRHFKAAVSPEEFDQMVSASWFLEFLAIWDDEQKEINTIAMVDQLHATFPENAKPLREEVAAWLRLEKLKEELGMD